jgi:hypothetical protein
MDAGRSPRPLHAMPRSTGAHNDETDRSGSTANGSPRDGNAHNGRPENEQSNGRGTSWQERSRHQGACELGPRASDAGDTMRLLDWALEYARHGWAVLPIYGATNGACTCARGVDCNSKGKHPRVKGGFKAATTDETAVRSYWSNWPDANVGIATGRVSGIWVLDIDPRHGGDKSLDRLEAEFSTLDHVAVVHTGGGGTHYYFAMPEDSVKSCSGVRQGIDVRGDGGYIVAPPSTHVSGRNYFWNAQEGEASLLRAPAWLEDLVLTPRPRMEERVDAATGHDDHALLSRQIPQGRRSDMLLSLAGKLRAVRIDQPMIEALLHDASQARCIPPLDDLEVIDIARRYADQVAPVLTPIVLSDLLHTDIPAPEYLVEPWLQVGNLCMVYAAAGIGKTWFAMTLALSIQGGIDFLGWKVGKARRVLYVDGEMGLPAMKDRFSRLVRGAGVDRTDNLALLSPSHDQPTLHPITTTAGQREIQAHLHGIDLLVLDNLSALCGGIDENDAAAYDPLNRWLVDLRRRGITVILVHHATKSRKEQRGTSKRVDALDVSICLERKGKAGKSKSFLIEFTKYRSGPPTDLGSKTVTIDSSQAGSVALVADQPKQDLEHMIAELLTSDMLQKDIATKLGTYPSMISRVKKKLQGSTTAPQ